MREYDYEPVPGLPDALPRGEILLWQGSPSWRGLARRALGIRIVAMYFVGLLAWREWTVIANGGDLAAVVVAAFLPVGMAVAAIGILCSLAWFAAKGTIYTVTNRRVVMRFGIAFPGAVNLPFSRIDSAGMWNHRDGTGDIALVLGRNARVGWLVMWPNVRLGSFSRPQPMLRAVAEPEKVACLLGDALAASSPNPIAVRVPMIELPDAAARPAFATRTAATV